MVFRFLVMLAAMASMVAAAAGCATNPVTGRRELRVISTPEEVTMGQRIDQQVRSQYQVITGTPAAERVQSIGKKIAAVADRQDLTYHFALIKSNEINAFAAPGGYIYVTTALVNATENDSQLAAVIGHEVGHVSALHAVQQVQRALGWQMLEDLIFSPDQAKYAQAADIVFNYVIQMGYSRQAEYEADALGVKYSAKAGYDPYGMAEFLGILEKVAPDTVSPTFEILQSHPNTEARRQRAEDLAAKYVDNRQIQGFRPSEQVAPK